MLDIEKRHRLERSLDSMAHRGPDDQGTFQNSSAWMGFRRLSILEISAKGHQPMRFQNGVLVFNGEIYNYRELRSRMNLKADSNSDCLVLGEWIQRFGIEGLKEIRGMFSFVWFSNNGQVLAARDPFGIKPLYYGFGDSGELCIASEATCVARLLSKHPNIDRQSLADVCATGSTIQPRTIWEHVHALPAGNVLQWNQAQTSIKISTFFQIDWAPSDEWITTEAEAAEQVREAVSESVNAHLISDVPVGLLLSGGLDSTVLAAALSVLSKSKSFHAFTLGYHHQSAIPDERLIAQNTASAYGLKYHSISIGPNEVAQALPDFFKKLDQPSGDGLNTYLTTKLAAQYVKVVLNGLGADEMLAGYRHFSLIALARHPWSRLATPFRPASAMADHFLGGIPASRPHLKGLRYLTGRMGRSPDTLQSNSRLLLPVDHVRKLCGTSSSFAQKDDSLPAETHDKAWLHHVLAYETKGYMRNVLLRDADAVSMAHSLELRVPFVDTKLFSVFRKIAPHLLIRNQQGKQPLRQAFESILPPDVRNEQKKRTFTLPIMEWIRQQPLKEIVLDVLSKQNIDRAGLVDTESALQIRDSFYNASGHGKSVYHLSQPLWVLFALHHWHSEVRQSLGTM